VPGELLTVLLVAGAAAAASVAGGLIALWRRPTPLFMSLALGFASGVLIATITLEMIPQALELGSLPVAAAGFAVGFGAMYGLDLFVHRGQIAGERSDKRPQVERFYQQRRPRGSEVTVLAGGTSAEEVIEGLAIGAGAAVEPRLALLIAAAIAVDNVSEALSIGEIICSESPDQGGHARRVLGWTGLIGVAVLVSAVAGWFLLRGAPEPVLGLLFAAGGGGMLYLTVTDLVPAGQEHQYEQSSALATGAGFLVVLLLSTLL
jgi:ZIP family zinc transporter